ncbi:DcaP family trimeric outer membrane transporter [Sphingobium subterraneum]|uniref:Porin n=1 Tax=Sphingobium subterraneum TaxID=627688 RepID=A0A841J387_9SPHN|nr:DcaP family trimeric outer membrane transporter [Sphingobium subterraneum]MBB6125277.1 hypothetical protein [Sphingobium subterraneum]
MRNKNRASIGLMIGTGVLALSVTGAQAATQKEQELEARIVALEKAFGTLTVELQTTKAENAQLREVVAETKAATVQATKAIDDARPALAAASQDGFTVGNGTTRVKIGGFLKSVVTFSHWDDGTVAANSLGRDFYLPQAIPTGGKSTTNNDFSAKQTRLWLNLETKLAGHTLKGYVETDFQTSAGTQGSERTTNGYNLALRRAYVQFDNLTVGQDWSTFQNASVLPESTDFVGPTEGTVFVRQPLVRFSKKLGKNVVLHLAAENAETQSAAPGLVENDQDKIPDFATRLNVSAGPAELALAGVARQLRVDSSTVSDTAFGWGVSGSGKISFGSNKRHDLKFMATYGKGIGRYVGLNFAPDAVINSANRLEMPEVFAAFTALKIGLTPTVRTTLMASYQDVNYPSGFAPGYFNGFNASALSVAGNIFWSPAKGFDLGAEYRHGQRELGSGAKGQLDRLEFAAKYSF